jgi:hypothetical protein
MRTLKRNELSKRAKREEEKFWLYMRSAESGKLCYS